MNYIQFEEKYEGAEHDTLAVQVGLHAETIARHIPPIREDGVTLPRLQARIGPLEKGQILMREIIDRRYWREFFSALEAERLRKLMRLWGWTEKSFQPINAVQPEKMIFNKPEPSRKPEPETMHKSMFSYSYETQQKLAQIQTINPEEHQKLLGSLTFIIADMKAELETMVDTVHEDLKDKDKKESRKRAKALRAKAKARRKSMDDKKRAKADRDERIARALESLGGDKGPSEESEEEED